MDEKASSSDNALSSALSSRKSSLFVGGTGLAGLEHVRLGLAVAAEKGASKRSLQMYLHSPACHRTFALSFIRPRRLKSLWYAAKILILVEVDPVIDRVEGSCIHA